MQSSIASQHFQDITSYSCVSHCGGEVCFFLRVTITFLSDLLLKFFSLQLMFCGYTILCPCVDLISFFLAQTSFCLFKQKIHIFLQLQKIVNHCISYNQILLQVTLKNNSKSKCFIQDGSLFLFHTDQAIQVVFDGVRGSGAL